eukprot:scaffold181903_cov30-Tisochrysis_lutea.AAC.6
MIGNGVPRTVWPYPDDPLRPIRGMRGGAATDWPPTLRLARAEAAHRAWGQLHREALVLDVDVNGCSMSAMQGSTCCLCEGPSHRQAKPTGQLDSRIRPAAHLRHASSICSCTTLSPQQRNRPCVRICHSALAPEWEQTLETDDAQTAPCATPSSDQPGAFNVVASAGVVLGLASAHAMPAAMCTICDAAPRPLAFASRTPPPRVTFLDEVPCPPISDECAARLPAVRRFWLYSRHAASRTSSSSSSASSQSSRMQIPSCRRSRSERGEYLCAWRTSRPSSPIVSSSESSSKMTADAGALEGSSVIRAFEMLSPSIS